MVLEENIIFTKTVGEKKALILNKLGIFVKGDLLKYFPTRYDKYEEISKIGDLSEGKTAVIYASPINIPVVKKTRKMDLVFVEVSDSSGKIMLGWFNSNYIMTKIKKGVHMVFRGRVTRKGNSLFVSQPEVLSIEEYRKKSSGLRPIYPLTKNLTSNYLLGCVQNVLAELDYEIEYLSHDILEKHRLMPLKKAIEEIHRPTNERELYEAHRRLVFDEFFLFSLSIDRIKSEEIEKNRIPQKRMDIVEEFIKKLPFELTQAQKRVWDEIEEDLTKGSGLNRLVQGDVGSGKTILVVIAALMVIKNGYQVAVMVPTEVLARQHYETFMGMLDKFDINIAFLTGSIRGKKREEILSKLSAGNIDLILGTQALIQEEVRYKNLALVVTDEQHRFGVKQREILSKKGIFPHILVMSATPIPRTLGLILYGDMDISIIDELPSDRLPIKNCVVTEEYRNKAYSFIEKEIERGHQIYIICPKIENEEIDSEISDVTSYTEKMRETLNNSVNIACLHGKLKDREKNRIMEDFSKGKIDILVSTTVVEVGINVPNATVMLIENSERFGLASLHQLRGRIGRGSSQSYCIFMYNNRSKTAEERLKILENSNDGFKIAEEDMKFRGSGDFFGVRQSGEPMFKIGNIIKDADILQISSKTVKSLNDKIKNECYYRSRIFYKDVFTYGKEKMTL